MTAAATLLPLLLALCTPYCTTGVHARMKPAVLSSELALGDEAAAAAAAREQERPRTYTAAMFEDVAEDDDHALAALHDNLPRFVQEELAPAAGNGTAPAPAPASNGTAEAPERVNVTGDAGAKGSNATEPAAEAKAPAPAPASNSTGSASNATADAGAKGGNSTAPSAPAPVNGTKASGNGTEQHAPVNGTQQHSTANATQSTANATQSTANATQSTANGTAHASANGTHASVNGTKGSGGGNSTHLPVTPVVKPRQKPHYVEAQEEAQAHQPNVECKSPGDCSNVRQRKWTTSMAREKFASVFQPPGKEVLSHSPHESGHLVHQTLRSTGQKRTVGLVDKRTVTANIVKPVDKTPAPFGFKKDVSCLETDSC